MNVRLNASLCCMAISSLLLAGCAGAPTNSSYPSKADMDAAQLPADIANLPQETLPGASRREAMALALGAARSKGWTIAKTGSDRIVLKRALDPAIAPIDGPDGPGRPIPPGSMLEVTSYFAGQGGGVKVASKAEVVTPAVGRQPPARMDYTRYYNDALAESLDSLRASWSANRGRIARATPPANGWADPWAGTPYAKSGGPKPETTTEKPAPAPTPEPGAERPRIAARAPADEAPVEQERSEGDRPAAERLAAERPAPLQREESRPLAASDQPPIPSRSARTPYPQIGRDPRRWPSAGAPVRDATTVLGTESASHGRLYPEPKIAPRNSMMALPSDRITAAEDASPAADGVSWAAYAEQYARQHGCKVSGGGAQLIESRRDGELHKVPCEDSDSFLVKCQNGTCQGIL